MPGADGFSPNPRKPHRIPRIRNRGINVDLPQKINGLGNIPKAPEVRPFAQVETGLDGRRGNHVTMVINVLLHNLTWKKSIKSS